MIMTRMWHEHSDLAVLNIILLYIVWYFQLSIIVLFKPYYVWADASICKWHVRLRHDQATHSATTSKIFNRGLQCSHTHTHTYAHIHTLSRSLSQSVTETTTLMGDGRRGLYPIKKGFSSLTMKIHKHWGTTHTIFSLFSISRICVYILWRKFMFNQPPTGHKMIRCICGLCGAIMKYKTLMSLYPFCPWRLLNLSPISGVRV